MGKKFTISGNSLAELAKGRSTNPPWLKPFTEYVTEVTFGGVIQSFRDRETRRFFEGQRVAAFQGFAGQAARRLVLLDGAETLGDLAVLPSNRLEVLQGDRAG